MRLVVPLAVLVSLGAHGVLLAGATITWGPEPVPDQSRPEARFDIAAQPVTASSARPAEAAGEAAPVAAAASQRLGGSAIPQSVTQASRPAAAVAASVSVAADAIPLARPAGPAGPTAAPDAIRLTQAPVSGQRLADAAISQTAARASLPAIATATAIPVVGMTLPAINASGAAARAAPPAAVTAPIVSAVGTTLAAADAVGAAAPAAALAAISAPAATPQSNALLSQPLPSKRGTAALAWVGDQGALDPLSLAAIQAFMQPSDLARSDANSGRLRDGIAGTLASVPCSRLQTSFDPETGGIELRGHLPDDALRAPVLSALQAQVGRALPVIDRLRVLPRPLCDVLGAIAGTGLAQSTEQETNPRIVGPDTFVRDYVLAAGQRVVLDMTAPDYPAMIYVDYFDAAGNVLHLQPNDRVPAVLYAPKSKLAVGQAAPGVPALELIVAPPYGQEIAVAYASSVPLYQGVRPTIEPAGPYLEFLKAAVAEARARMPDFKGEWVYYFVTTSP